MHALVFLLWITQPSLDWFQFFMLVSWLMAREGYMNLNSFSRLIIIINVLRSRKVGFECSAACVAFPLLFCLHARMESFVSGLLFSSFVRTATVYSFHFIFLSLPWCHSKHIENCFYSLPLALFFLLCMLIASVLLVLAMLQVSDGHVASSQKIRHFCERMYMYFRAHSMQVYSLCDLFGAILPCQAPWTQAQKLSMFNKNNKKCKKIKYKEFHKFPSQSNS